MKNDGAMNVVEMFSLVHENWSRASPMQSGRRCFRLLVAGGKMYAIGGEDAKAGLISSVEAYDPVIGGWTYVASMNHARAGFGKGKHSICQILKSGFNRGLNPFRCRCSGN